jgi:hypothetical protein
VILRKNLQHTSHNLSQLGTKCVVTISITETKPTAMEVKEVSRPQTVINDQIIQKVSTLKSLSCIISTTEKYLEKGNLLQ